MQVSGTFPQLSNNERKSLKAQLTPRKVAPKVAPKKVKVAPKEKSNPRTANSRTFGVPRRVPAGLAQRREAARKAAGR